MNSFAKRLAAFVGVHGVVLAIALQLALTAN